MNIHPSIVTPQQLPPSLASLVSLAALLERLELQPSSASPQQYQQLAKQVAALLEQAEPDLYLDALLTVAPASAQIYENLRYEHAGLCREPLEAALNAELAARAAIDKARGAAR